MDILLSIANQTLRLFIETAPWLLLGLASAGLLHAFMPTRQLVRWIGGSGLGPACRAALLGTPLPLCSCSVIPVGLQLHRSGASREATTAFFIATPETGADSVGASYALLGPWFTIARPLAAVVTAISTAFATRWLAGPSKPRPVAPRQTDSTCCASPVVTTSQECASTQAPSSSCCSPSQSDIQPSCCSEAPASSHSSNTSASIIKRAGAGLHYATTQLLDEFKGWLLLGLAIAGVTLALVPPTLLSSISHGWLAMLIMLAISIPLYVCATESTPIATALLAAGVMPGAVLVFLLAGPATNIATIQAVRTEFGRRFAICYVTGVAACALIAGALFDILVGWFSPNFGAASTAIQHAAPGWISIAAAALLAFLMLAPLRDRLFSLRRTGL